MDFRPVYRVFSMSTTLYILLRILISIRDTVRRSHGHLIALNPTRPICPCSPETAMVVGVLIDFRFSLLPLPVGVDLPTKHRSGLQTGLFSQVSGLFFAG